MNPDMVCLRIIHIVSGVFWVGGFLFLIFILIPRLRTPGPAVQGPVMGAVIVEPVAANMGVVPPNAGFLDGLQELCRSNGALFILDEVITGFRASPGGAQARWALEPDITCLGKSSEAVFPSALTAAVAT